jgi:hypothetical protein
MVLASLALPVARLRAARYRAASSPTACATPSCALGNWGRQPSSRLILALEERAERTAAATALRPAITRARAAGTRRGARTPSARAVSAVRERLVVDHVIDRPRGAPSAASKSAAAATSTCTASHMFSPRPITARPPGPRSRASSSFAYHPPAHTRGRGEGPRRAAPIARSGAHPPDGAARLSQLVRVARRDRLAS